MLNVYVDIDINSFKITNDAKRGLMQSVSMFVSHIWVVDIFGWSR